jgi:hypothetical protein
VQAQEFRDVQHAAKSTAKRANQASFRVVVVPSPFERSQL